RVDAADRVERAVAAAARRGDAQPLPRLHLLVDRHRERLFAGEAVGRGALAVEILQRQHAHADQVAAVDALVALGEHEPDPAQDRALRGPVPRAAGAVLLAGEPAQRRAGAFVLHRRGVDGRLLAGRPEAGEAALAARQRVLQLRVGEGAARHHAVVAAPAAVAVEVLRLHAVLEQVAPGRRVLLDRARRRDVVG